jgi:hypothetical protein
MAGSGAGRARDGPLHLPRRTGGKAGRRGCAPKGRQQAERIAVNETDPCRDDGELKELGDRHSVLSAVSDRGLAVGADMDEDPTLFIARRGVQLRTCAQPPFAADHLEQLVQALISPFDLREIVATILATPPADLLQHVVVCPRLLPRHAVAPVGERKPDVRVIFKTNRLDGRPLVDHGAGSHPEPTERVLNGGWIDPDSFVRPRRCHSEADDVGDTATPVTNATNRRRLDDSTDHSNTIIAEVSNPANSRSIARHEDRALSIDDVTTVVVNFRTLEETRACLTTLRQAYPTLRVLVIDNGSADDSIEFLRRFQAEDGSARVIFNDANIFHGPALDQGMHEADTDLVFLLDSDCEIRHGGFLEPLVDGFSDDPLLYAIGKRGYTNRYGYGPISRGEPWTYYVHPFAAVVDRKKYFTLPPFVHHGAPLYRNMWGAGKTGYHLRHVTIEDHVVHRGRVTASVHGYGYSRRLLIQARVNALDHRIRSTAARVLGRELRAPELPPARTGEPPELREDERRRTRSA